MEKVIFIGEYNFPSSFAASNRVLYMAKCAQKSGYDTLVIGKGRMKESDFFDTYKGICYTSMQPKAVPIWKKILLFPNRHFAYRRVLKKQIMQGNVKAVIIYASSSARYVPQVIKLCRKMGVKCICDISEWYDKKQFAHGRWNLNYQIFSYMFNHWFEKASNIICCSELVKGFFEKKGCNCLKINGIIDVSEYSPDFTVHHPITLIYSGVAGKKDYLVEFFQAFDRLKEEEKTKIKIKIVGMSKDYLSNLFKELGYSFSLDPKIEILDHMPKNQLIEHIKNADYSILLRPNERYANAGFASKVPESMALGTPMMCNITSDLGDYLTSQNAVILSDCSVDEILKAIRERILIFSDDERIQQRKSALEQAKKSFDLSVFELPLRAFIEK